MIERHYKIIASLVGIILLLIICIAAISTKTEIKEVEVVKEKVITVEKEPTYAYNISSVEREMLTRLVYLEANTESLECQSAIVSVVINRWESGKWGSAIAEVIYSQYQFSPSDLTYKTTPTETNYEAVDQVLRNGATLPSYVMYFRAGYHFDWEGYQPYINIDNTYFGYFLADK